jgi:preprotein translocase subunit SecA
MLKRVISAVVGSRHERERRRIQPIVDEINEWDAKLQQVSEEELRDQTRKFRALLAERTSELEKRIVALREQKRTAKDAAEREKIDLELGGGDGRGGVEGSLRQTISETLDEILPEAFATVRVATRKLMGTTMMVTGREMTWDMIPYDVQLMGGIQLHFGRIAEMATGDASALSQRIAGEGRAPRHGQLLPGSPRFAVDGTRIHLPRPHGGLPGRHGTGNAESAQRVPL